MRDRFLISRDETVNNCWHDASITLSYLVKCVSCARTIPSHVVFPVLSMFFTHRLLLYFHVRSWRCRDVTLVDTESIAGEFCSQTENVAALMPCLPSKKRFQRVDPGTKLMSSIGAIRQKRARTISSLVQAHRGGSAFAGISEFGCRNVMAQVVASSVAWSRSVFAGSDARRIFISADEFNRESSRMILICRDLCSNVGVSSVAGDATQSRKTSDGIFVLFFFSTISPLFAIKTPKRHF